MAWKVYGTPYASGDLSDTTVSQGIKFHQNMLVKAFRIWVVVVGAPVMTGLRLKVYGNNEQSDIPSKLLYTSSNSWDMADILTTYTHGVKEIYFDFDDSFSVHADNLYHLVLNADTYTPSGSNEFAWRTVWPDPVYTENYTVTGNNYLNSPNFVSAVIGSVI